MAKKGRKRKLDSEDIGMMNWERENIMSDELQNEMKTMWEIPQICHFLHLTKEALNIGPLSMYEMERMLLMPRASRQLAHIMTCLLSPPMLKTKLRRIPPMPYEYWTNILMHKIKGWFKIYHSKHEDTVKVLESTGVEPEFWKIFPDVSLIEGKDFEELTFRQRVWLLKTVCDAMMHARKTVQEEMAKQLTDEPSETLLGTDRYGARYIYFPQFMENDVRVYRHCLDNEVLSTVKPPKKKVDVKLEVKTDNKNTEVVKSSRSRRRKCRWRNGSLPLRIRKRAKRQTDISNCEYTPEGATESLGSEDTNLSTMSICSNNNHSDLGSERSKRSRSSSKNSEESVISNQTKSGQVTKSSGYDTNTSNDTKSNDEMPFLMEEFQGFPKTTDSIVGDLSATRSIQKSDSSDADAKSIKTTEDAINSAKKINEKLNEASHESDLNDTNSCNINNSDSRSCISNSISPKPNDIPSTNKIHNDASMKCENKIAEITSKPKTNDSTDVALKDLPDSTVLHADDLSNSSKTDDEKLNDIMSVDGSTIDVSKNSTVMTDSVDAEKAIGEGVEKIANEVNIEKILSISKSDDQKLIETKMKDGKKDGADTNIDNTLDKHATLNKVDSASASEPSLIDKTNNIVGEEEDDEEGEEDDAEEAEEEYEGEEDEEEEEAEQEEDNEDDEPEEQMEDSTEKIVDKTYRTRGALRSRMNNKSDEAIEKIAINRPRRNVRSTYNRLCIYEDNKSEYSSDPEPTLSELKDRLLKENQDNSKTNHHDNTPVWEKYNLRKPKKIKKQETEENIIENFYEMLGDLSISSFVLVADSIEALKELISANFPANVSGGMGDTWTQTKTRPQCEMRLLKKIKNLIVTLRERESSLNDVMKKARAKLHKEWTNFKEGVVEDQDWSSEGSLALGSNWWVIGSQGCHPLPPTGDATISSLSQLTLPSLGARAQLQLHDDPNREQNDQAKLQDDNAKQQRSQQAGGHRDEMQQDATDEHEKHLRLKSKSGRNKETGDQSEEADNQIDNPVEADLSSRRVLRARGVSSYMEQVFTSDDDIEEDELEGWPDIETKYAPTCTSPNTPASCSASTSGPAEAGQSEDSDKDWILPCARKRKNRRPVARKLKSLQQRLQHMNDEMIEANFSATNDPSAENISRKKGLEQTEKRTDSNGINQKRTSSNLSNPKANVSMVSNVQCSQAVPSGPICRIESVHSEIDIKDEVTLPNVDQSQNMNNYNMNVQPAGYVVVKTEQGPMTNYYLMSQTTPVPSIVQQSTMIPNIIPQVPQAYYVQAGQNYIVQAPQSANFLTTQTIQQNPQSIIAPQARPHLLQQAVTHNYMPMPGYVVQPPPINPSGPRGFIVNQGVRPQFVPTQNIRMTNQLNIRNRPPPLVGNGTPFPHGAVIRSSAPPRGNGMRNSRPKAKNLALRALAPQQSNPKLAQKDGKASRVQKTRTNATANTTSLIVLSDSDDEIEMIITENTKPTKATSTTNIPSQELADIHTTQKPIVTSHVTVSPGSSILPPQIMQRMSQGGISITPVKTSQSQTLQNPNTQLVVVVNETGSHYALSLPNGSKLILTPDQVAQIRASNNGKLML